LDFSYHYDLAKVLYQDGNLSVELLSGSGFDLSGKLDIGLNIRDSRLREFETTFSGSATAKIVAGIQLKGKISSSGTTALITPIRKVYYVLIGNAPVWVDVTYELNAG
jgi:hypothetical protein